jgi:hypothetical protein
MRDEAIVTTALNEAALFIGDYLNRVQETQWQPSTG